MVDYPSNVLRICEAAVNRHASDIEKAVVEAEKKVRDLPEFPELVDKLIHTAIQEIIYDIRHHANVRMKQNMGSYGGRAKVTSGSCPTVNRIAEDLYRYSIAGTILGLVTGKQLPEIADSEAAVGNGHLFNARLCRSLAKIVPEDKRVQDVVNQKKLKEIWLASKP